MYFTIRYGIRYEQYHFAVCSAFSVLYAISNSNVQRVKKKREKYHIIKQTVCHQMCQLICAFANDRDHVVKCKTKWREGKSNQPIVNVEMFEQVQNMCS